MHTVPPVASTLGPQEVHGHLDSTDLIQSNSACCDAFAIEKLGWGDGRQGPGAEGRGRGRGMLLSVQDGGGGLHPQCALCLLTMPCMPKCRACECAKPACNHFLFLAL